MHADKAARIATGAAGLLAEARGVRAVVKRQVGCLEHLAGVDVGQLHLGRGDQVEALTGFEQVVLELGQLAGAGQRVGVGHGRAPPLGVAAAGVRVGHEVDDGALQACGLAAQQDEAAGSQLHGTLGLEHVQVGAQVPVRLHLDALGLEVARGAPAAHLGVVVLVIAHGGGVGRHVRRAQQDVVQLGIGGLALGGDGGQLVVDLADALLGGLGLVLLAGGHHLADALGRGVALGLQSLLLGDGGTTGFVKFGEARRVP